MIKIVLAIIAGFISPLICGFIIGFGLTALIMNRKH
jgi:hypothetical protein